MEKKRIVAVKTNVSPIVDGRFVPAEGFNPSYVLTSSGTRISRARVLATVVNKFVSESGRFAALTLDDGTATIGLKAFGWSNFEGIERGDIVDVIARVKEYNNEIYLVPEVVCKTDDMNFELLRELELRQRGLETEKRRMLVHEYAKQTADVGELGRLMKERFNMEQEEVEALLSAEEKEEKEKENTKEEILSLIEHLDAGDGCDYTELIRASGLAEEAIDTVVNELLGEGSCFEPRPGRIKKL